MNLEEIKTSVEQGIPVHYKSLLYKVIKDSKGQYLIKCASNSHCIGLTWADNKTLNGKESDFFVPISVGFDSPN